MAKELKAIATYKDCGNVSASLKCITLDAATTGILDSSDGKNFYLSTFVSHEYTASQLVRWEDLCKAKAYISANVSDKIASSGATVVLTLYAAELKTMETSERIVDVIDFDTTQYAGDVTYDAPEKIDGKYVITAHIGANMSVEERSFVFKYKYKDLEGETNEIVQFGNILNGVYRYQIVSFSDTEQTINGIPNTGATVVGNDYRFYPKVTYKYSTGYTQTASSEVIWDDNWAESTVAINLSSIGTGTYGDADPATCVFTNVGSATSAATYTATFTIPATETILIGDTQSVTCTITFKQDAPSIVTSTTEYLFDGWSYPSVESTISGTYKSILNPNTEVYRGEATVYYHQRTARTWTDGSVDYVDESVASGMNATASSYETNPATIDFSTIQPDTTTSFTTTCKSDIVFANTYVDGSYTSSIKKNVLNGYSYTLYAPTYGSTVTFKNGSTVLAQQTISENSLIGDLYSTEFILEVSPGEEFESLTATIEGGNGIGKFNEEPVMSFNQVNWETSASTANTLFVTVSENYTVYSWSPESYSIPVSGSNSAVTASTTGVDYFQPTVTNPNEAISIGAPVAKNNGYEYGMTISNTQKNAVVTFSYTDDNGSVSKDFEVKSDERTTTEDYYVFEAWENVQTRNYTTPAATSGSVVVADTDIDASPQFKYHTVTVTTYLNGRAPISSVNATVYNTTDEIVITYAPTAWTLTSNMGTTAKTYTSDVTVQPSADLITKFGNTYTACTPYQVILTQEAHAAELYVTFFKADGIGDEGKTSVAHKYYVGDTLTSLPALTEAQQVGFLNWYDSDNNIVTTGITLTGDLNVYAHGDVLTWEDGTMGDKTYGASIDAGGGDVPFSIKSYYYTGNTVSPCSGNIYDENDNIVGSFSGSSLITATNNGSFSFSHVNVDTANTYSQDFKFQCSETPRYLYMTGVTQSACPNVTYIMSTTSDWNLTPSSAKLSGVTVDVVVSPSDPNTLIASLVVPQYSLDGETIIVAPDTVKGQFLPSATTVQNSSVLTVTPEKHYLFDTASLTFDVETQHAISYTDYYYTEEDVPKNEQKAATKNSNAYTSYATRIMLGQIEGVSSSSTTQDNKVIYSITANSISVSGDLLFTSAFDGQTKKCTIVPATTYTVFASGATEPSEMTPSTTQTSEGVWYKTKVADGVNIVYALPQDKEVEQLSISLDKGGVPEAITTSTIKADPDVWKFSGGTTTALTTTVTSTKTVTNYQWNGPSVVNKNQTVTSTTYGTDTTSALDYSVTLNSSTQITVTNSGKTTTETAGVYTQGFTGRYKTSVKALSSPYYIVLTQDETNQTAQITVEQKLPTYEIVMWFSNGTVKGSESTTMTRSVLTSTSQQPTALTQIWMSSAVTSVDSGACSGCTSLTAITFGGTSGSPLTSTFGDTANGSNIASVNDNAFSGCTKLTSLAINLEQTKTLGTNAFASCTSMTTTVLSGMNNTIKIGTTPFASTTGDLYISCTSDNTFIPESMFENSAFSSVTFGLPTVLSLNYGASSAVNELKVTQIKDSAFKNNKKLKSFIIPDSVTTLGANVFSGDTALTALTISSGLTEVSYKKVHSGATKVQELVIKSPSIYGAEHYSAASSSVSGGAWSGYTALTKVEIVSSYTATTIPYYAFHNCSALTQVVFADNVYNQITGISSYAFASTKLTDRFSNASATSAKYDMPTNIVKIGDYAFGGSKIRQIIIHDKIESIGTSAFCKTTSATTLTIDEPIAGKELTIGDHAFDSSKIASTTTTPLLIPSATTVIGVSAFQSCSGLKGVNVQSYGSTQNNTVIKDYAFQYCHMSALTLSEHITEIGKFAFDDNDLTNLVIPSTVEAIGLNPWTDNPYLETIIVHTSNTHYTSRNKSGLECNMIADITVSALTTGCYTTKQGSATTNLPSTITYLRDYCFCGNMVLTDSHTQKKNPYVIGSGVTYIGDYAFYKCDALAYIRDNQGYFASVEEIGDHAFDWCTNLKQAMILPDCCETVGRHAFSCTQIYKVHLGSGFTYLDWSNEGGYMASDDSAFSYCPLSAITVSSANSYYRGVSNAVISNDDGRKSIYLVSSQTDYDAIHKDYPQITTIADYAGYGNSAITTLRINNSIYDISLCAFYDCDLLEDIEISATTANPLTICTKAFEIGNNEQRLGDDYEVSKRWSHISLKNCTNIEGGTFDTDSYYIESGEKEQFNFVINNDSSVPLTLGEWGSSFEHAGHWISSFTFNADTTLKTYKWNSSSGSPVFNSFYYDDLVINTSMTSEEWKNQNPRLYGYYTPNNITINCSDSKQLTYVQRQYPDDTYYWDIADKTS